MNRDNVSEEAALKASSIRMSINELVELAKDRIFEPYVIKNNSDLDSLYLEIDNVIKKIMEE